MAVVVLLLALPTSYRYIRPVAMLVKAVPRITSCPPTLIPQEGCVRAAGDTAQNWGEDSNTEVSSHKQAAVLNRACSNCNMHVFDLSGKFVVPLPAPFFSHCARRGRPLLLACCCCLLVPVSTLALVLVVVHDMWWSNTLSVMKAVSQICDTCKYSEGWYLNLLFCLLALFIAVFTF